MTYEDDLIRLMSAYVRNPTHHQLITNAAQFIGGVTTRLRKPGFALAREREIDPRLTAQAISAFVGRPVLTVSVMSVPPGSEDYAPWWAHDDAYRRTLTGAVHDDKAFPDTDRKAETEDGRLIVAEILTHLSNLGYWANTSINKAAKGLAWNDNAALPGYHLWYATVFPVISQLAQAAALNLRSDADRAVRLATILRQCLPLGERKKQEYSWIVLAAPDA